MILLSGAARLRRNIVLVSIADGGDAVGKWPENVATDSFPPWYDGRPREQIDNRLLKSSTHRASQSAVPLGYLKLRDNGVKENMAHAAQFGEEVPFSEPVSFSLGHKEVSCHA